MALKASFPATRLSPSGVFSFIARHAIDSMNRGLIPWLQDVRHIPVPQHAVAHCLDAARPSSPFRKISRIPNTMTFGSVVSIPAPCGVGQTETQSPQAVQAFNILSTLSSSDLRNPVSASAIGVPPFN
jgi:hypothetical protein